MHPLAVVRIALKFKCINNRKFIAAVISPIIFKIIGINLVKGSLSRQLHFNYLILKFLCKYENVYMLA